MRLGELNAQTRWVLERSGAPEPDFLPHVMLRVRRRDAREFPVADHASRSARSGWRWPHDDLDLVPIVDDDGVLAGVMTERALARRYIRESREARASGRADDGGAVVHVLEGELVAGEDQEVNGRVWVAPWRRLAPAPIGPAT